jgi:hypothetical protein
LDSVDALFHGRARLSTPKIGSMLVLTGDPADPSKLALDITFLKKPAH